MGMAKISVPERTLVPEAEYDKFLATVTDPDQANYWDVVSTLPRTQHIHMEVEDNVFCLYEMVNGAIGVFHVGRPFHPSLPGTGGAGLQIYGTEGKSDLRRRALGLDHQQPQAPITAGGCGRLVPHGRVGDVSKAVWPKPIRRVQLLSRFDATPARLYHRGARAGDQRGVGPPHHGDDDGRD